MFTLVESMAKSKSNKVKLFPIHSILENDFQESFLKAFPMHRETVVNNKISVKLLLRKIHNAMGTTIANNRRGISLPYNMGTVKAIVRERKRQDGKVFFFIGNSQCGINNGINSDPNLVKITHIRNENKKDKFRNMWTFKPGQTVKKQVAKNFMEKQSFYEIAIPKLQENKTLIDTTEYSVPSNYNEFEM